MALTKLLKNTLDGSSKLKNMSNERLVCLTKSPLSQNFYRTMSDLSKTLILHPVAKLLESSKNDGIKGLRFFVKYSCAQENLEKVVKVTVK